MATNIRDPQWEYDQITRRMQKDINLGVESVTIGNHKLDNETLGMLLDAGQFMKYLIEVDPDIKDKYTAFRAAKKILNKE